MRRKRTPPRRGAWDCFEQADGLSRPLEPLLALVETCRRGVERRLQTDRVPSLVPRHPPDLDWTYATQDAVAAQKLNQHGKTLRCLQTPCLEFRLSLHVAVSPGNASRQRTPMTDSKLWLPLLITLVSLVTTLAVFWAWSKRAPPAKRTRGTRIVTDSEGNNVRRSTRCVWRPARFQNGQATGQQPRAEPLKLLACAAFEPCGREMLSRNSGGLLPSDPVSDPTRSAMAAGRASPSRDGVPTTWPARPG